MKGKSWTYIVAAACAVLMGALGLVSGCAGQKNLTDDEFFEKWRDRAERSKGFTPTRKKITADLEDKKKLGYPQRAELKVQPARPLPNRRITVKLKDLEVSTVLRAVARAVDQNIVINEAIKGTVTVDVKNAPWDQVFLGVLRSHGLSYAWEGDIIRVMSAEDKKEEVKREIKTVIIPIEFADAKQLKDNIQSVLTTSEKTTTEAGKPQSVETKVGSVLVDVHNNALIIQASVEDIQRLIPVIEALDRPTSQVLIEAHIVEATKDTARELGVQWGGLYHSGNQWIYPGANSSGITGSNIGLPGGPALQGQTTSPGEISPTSGFASNFPSTSFTGTMPTIGYTGFTLGYLVGLTAESMLAAQLTALQTDGKLNILSSPSITTLDNQMALIESGKEVPFQTVDENGKLVIQWKKATLKLEVTPHVVEGNILKLKIQTKKDELDFTNTVMGNPTIITKNAETNVIVSDGETTVIGGLNKETGQGSVSGIPGLKDIPVLGWLFKADRKSSNLEEVLIFITPYILKEKKLEEGPGKVSQSKSK
ncbi:MAG: type IV pilus secretin PilQ [Thermodesulfobacteriota bacterium]